MRMPLPCLPSGDKLNNKITGTIIAPEGILRITSGAIVSQHINSYCSLRFPFRSALFQRPQAIVLTAIIPSTATAGDAPERAYSIAAAAKTNNDEINPAMCRIFSAFGASDGGRSISSR